MSNVAAATLASNNANRRIAFVRWVRRTHGWFGLWGAILGLMTGTSGVWLNHRSVMKLDLPDQQQTSARLAVPDPRPATPEAMSVWLQDALKTDRPASSARVERSRPVPWTEQIADRGTVMQPERWTFVFGGPNKVIQVEYWLGNQAATVRTSANGFIATLTNLHKGATMPVPWILLIDTLAGSLIFLSVSGAILWWETHRKRLAGMVILGLSLGVTAALAVSSLQW